MWCNRNTRAVCRPVAVGVRRTGVLFICVVLIVGEQQCAAESVKSCAAGQALITAQNVPIPPYTHWSILCRWYGYAVDGQRTYVAGVQRMPDGQTLLFCCVTLAAVVDTCEWDSSSTRFAIGEYPVNATRSRSNTKLSPTANVLIRDIVNNGDDTDMFKVEVPMSERWASVKRLRTKLFISAGGGQNLVTSVTRTAVALTTTNQTSTTTATTTTSSPSTTTTTQPPANSATRPNSIRAQTMTTTAQQPPIPFQKDDSGTGATKTALVKSTKQRQPSAGNATDSNNTVAGGGNHNSTCPTPDFHPCVDLHTANTMFANCCRQKLRAGCVKYCRYDMSQNAIVDAVLAEDPPCPMKDILACGAQYQNTTDCCVNKQVVAGKYAVCAPYCTPATSTDDFVSIKFMPCMDKMKQITQCYLSYLNPS